MFASSIVSFHLQPPTPPPVEVEEEGESDLGNGWSVCTQLYCLICCINTKTIFCVFFCVYEVQSTHICYSPVVYTN